MYLKRIQLLNFLLSLEMFSEALFFLSYIANLDYPYWNDVKEYGNTVSSSIPIALVDMMKTNQEKDISKVMSIGFGVGLSWGGCVISMSKFS